MNKSIKLVALGSGNVANHLIPALSKKKVEILCVYSRNKKTSRSLAKKIKCKSSTTLNRIPKKADVYLLMLPDEGIKEVIANWPFPINENQLLLHTSGSLKTLSLKSISNQYGAFYPLQTFKKGEKLSITRIPFLLNAESEKSLQFMKKLALKLSKNIFEISDEERQKLHIAAVLFNNFTTALFISAHEYLAKENVSSKPLEPIIENTFQNLLTSGNPATLQTGPAIRGESNTIIKHQKMLKGYPEIKKMYKSISDYIQHYFYENHS